MKLLAKSFWAVLLGLLVVGSVGPSWVGAANNAAEVLNSDGSRPLAGSTRYATATRIAQQFVDEGDETGDYDVREAVLVSGVGFADALSAAALAGNYRAPILLTDPQTLTGVTRSFLTRNNIDEVFIVGGTAAVSASVAAAVDALPGVAVTRLAGSDRYATALEVARHVGGNTGASLNAYCSTNDNAVLLANGLGFADALAGGPLAYDGPYPILLTPPTGLPSSVVDYLGETRVERVVILGGVAVVPTAVQSQITRLGIEVTRLAGSNRFGTAAEISEALTDEDDGCDWSPSAFGLANGRVPFDALAGSALLGERQSPLLLTETTSLPKATSDHLATTPLVVDGESNTVMLSVFGGTAAVSAATVTQAVDAAITSNPITATIVAAPGENSFVVNFSEEVDLDTAEAPTSYLLAGDPLLSDDTIVYSSSGADPDNENPHVVITLNGLRLAAGEIITVVGDAIRAEDYDLGDERFVSRRTFTVPEDNLRPRVTIYAIPGAEDIYIRLSEFPHNRDGNELSGFDVDLDPATGADEILDAAVSSVDDLLWVAPVGGTLVSGDRINVEARALYDRAGNANSLTRAVVPRSSRPTLTSLTVSSQRFPTNARTDSISGIGNLEIEARASGEFAGAGGNSWTVQISGTSSTSVSVGERREAIFISVRDPDFGGSGDRNATIGEILRAADQSEAFTRNFRFVGRSSLTSRELAREATPVYGTLDLAGGETSAVVTARWSQPVTVTESSIDSCPTRCTDRNDGIPSGWTLTDRSATSSDASEILEWEAPASDDATEVPTGAWSLRFNAGAVTGIGNVDNVADTERLRLRSS